MLLNPAKGLRSAFSMGALYSAGAVIIGMLANETVTRAVTARIPALQSGLPRAGAGLIAAGGVGTALGAIIPSYSGLYLAGATAQALMELFKGTRLGQMAVPGQAPPEQVEQAVASRPGLPEPSIRTPGILPGGTAGLSAATALEGLGETEDELSDF
jgi:hypothetical protein